MVWKILCLSNIVSNIFLSVTFALVLYRTIKSKKSIKNSQPTYKKYGSK